ncbi:hypothetical protein ACHHYP_20216 [Achlya hypogyna]|uniref:F-box domain-containing protein n=1 Tax=Achlya hypogyna TaxID=1202772 RepID=A0A1V9ZPE5_ACHHY|nr:hypothetical protein ACHHYP_20216 [Achlya hypogyna]
MPPRTRSKRSSDTLAAPNKRHCPASYAFDFGHDVLAKLVEFLSPLDALSLSTVSKGLYVAMDNRIWRTVLVTQCYVSPHAPRLRSKARDMLATILAKSRCVHCGGTDVAGCKIIRVHTEHYGKKLCKVCTSLPLYREISHDDAITRYRIEGWQLAAVPNRLLTSTWDREVALPYRQKMYNLQAILDLVEKLQSSAQEAKDQEIAHTAARQSFADKEFECISRPGLILT